MVKFIYMWKRLEDKRWSLVLSLFALAAMVFLVSALRDMSFRPAQPLGSSETEKAQFIEVATSIIEIIEIPFWKHMMFWGGMFILVLVVASLLTPEMRKRLIMGFLRLAVFALVVLYIVKHDPELLTNLFPDFTQANAAVSSSPTDAATAPVFEPPQVSNILIYVIGFVVLLIVAFIFWKLIGWWGRVKKELAAARQPMTEIAAIVRSSLKEIASGENSTNAIIRCYEQMSYAVDEKRGLRRDFAMTVSEFAERLERAGLPHEPVQRLTRLFESVRYGAGKTAPRDVDEAVVCLNAILKYCGEKA